MYLVLEGFLIAVCQNYARLNKVTVDSLTYTHKVLPLTQDEDLSFNRKESILNKAFKVRMGLKPVSLFWLTVEDMEYLLICSQNAGIHTNIMYYSCIYA